MKSRERIVDYLRRRKGRGALPASAHDPEMEEQLQRLAERGDAPHRRASKRPSARTEKRT